MPSSFKFQMETLLEKIYSLGKICFSTCEHYLWPILLCSIDKRLVLLLSACRLKPGLVDCKVSLVTGPCTKISCITCHEEKVEACVGLVKYVPIELPGLAC